MLEDLRHRDQEVRYHALGKTLEERLLHITFTLRGDRTLIRVISTRATCTESKGAFMSKPAKPLPRFKTEAQERAYWETEGRDSTQFIDWTKAQRVALPELKPILITL